MSVIIPPVVLIPTSYRTLMPIQGVDWREEVSAWLRVRVCVWGRRVVGHHSKTSISKSTYICNSSNLRSDLQDKNCACDQEAGKESQSNVKHHQSLKLKRRTSKQPSILSISPPLPPSIAPSRQSQASLTAEGSIHSTLPHHPS